MCSISAMASSKAYFARLQAFEGSFSTFHSYLIIWFVLRSRTRRSWARGPVWWGWWSLNQPPRCRLLFYKPRRPSKRPSRTGRPKRTQKCNGGSLLAFLRKTLCFPNYCKTLKSCFRSTRGYPHRINSTQFLFSSCTPWGALNTCCPLTPPSAQWNWEPSTQSY